MKFFFWFIVARCKKKAMWLEFSRGLPFLPGADIALVPIICSGTWDAFDVKKSNVVNVSVMKGVSFFLFLQYICFRIESNLRVSASVQCQSNDRGV